MNDSERQATAEPVFVDVLTDEELSVVARSGPMPVMPFLATLPSADQDTARRSAYRSLVARGVLSPPTPEAVAAATAVRDGSVDLEVRQDIASVVALRAGAQLVVAVARTTAVTQDYWYAHLVDDVVLLEEVSRDGLHRFALAPAERLEALTHAACLHPDTADGSGPEVAVEAAPDDPTPPDEVLERLGAAFVRADLVVRRPGDTDPPALALFSGPGGCWALVPEPPRTRAVPLGVDEARARVGDAVAAVRAEAVTLHG